MEDRDRCRDCGEKRPADLPGGLSGLPAAGRPGRGRTRRRGNGTGTTCPTRLRGRRRLRWRDLRAGRLERLAETLGGIPRVLLRDTEAASGADPLVQPASPEMPAPADRPARLQLLGEIARGGMGAVLKGRDADLGRDLAVKVLLERAPRRPRAGPPVRRGGPDRRPAPAPRHRAGLRAGHASPTAGRSSP